MMTFLLFTTASKTWLGWRKTKKCTKRPRREILWPALIVESYTDTLLRYVLSVGTLRTGNGDVHEKVAEKQTWRHFKTFSRLFHLGLLLKRRRFWLELKRGERTQVRTALVEFIALPFPFPYPFPCNLTIWSFHAVVVQWRQRNVQNKRDARAELLFCSLNLLFFDVPVAVIVVS